MQEKKTIEHAGVVESTGNGKIFVNVMAESACASCHAKGSCSVGNVENKIVEVKTNDDSFESGERVMVKLSQSLGFRALFFGYVFPFILVIMVLAIATEAGLSEGKAGLLAILPLPVYYIVLYFLKDRMKQMFSFSVHKIV